MMHSPHFGRNACLGQRELFEQKMGCGLDARNPGGQCRDACRKPSTSKCSDGVKTQWPISGSDRLLVHTMSVGNGYQREDILIALNDVNGSQRYQEVVIKLFQSSTNNHSLSQFICSYFLRQKSWDADRCVLSKTDSLSWLTDKYTDTLANTCTHICTNKHTPHAIHMHTHTHGQTDRHTLMIMHAHMQAPCTARCGEIGSLMSLDAWNSGASSDAGEPISLHQTVQAYTCMHTRIHTCKCTGTSLGMHVDTF